MLFDVQLLFSIEKTKQIKDQKCNHMYPDLLYKYTLWLNTILASLGHYWKYDFSWFLIVNDF